MGYAPKWSLLLGCIGILLKMRKLSKPNSKPPGSRSPSPPGNLVKFALGGEVKANKSGAPVPFIIPNWVQKMAIGKMHGMSRRFGDPCRSEIREKCHMFGVFNGKPHPNISQFHWLRVILLQTASCWTVTVPQTCWVVTLDAVGEILHQW